ncbi:unnamed protein product [Phaeothamnion confervicola]
MADSWEDHDGKSKKAGALNPNAASFSFNPTASSWTPGGPAPAPTGGAAGAGTGTGPKTARASPPRRKSPSPSPPRKGSPVRRASPHPPSPPAAAAANGSGGDRAGDHDEEEEIDENDPLWRVTLRLAGGDRTAALKMLEDPDTLMVHPEVVKVIEGGATPEDAAWGAPPPAPPGGGGGDFGEASGGGGGGGGGDGAAGGAVAADGEEDDEGADGAVAEAEAEAEEDPREHVNLVFIGHVDAGKSTLSGNILYLMGFVDARTIERYEREAKQRNRESWFLAYIMDTNEEERAKGKTVEVGRAHFETPAKR